MTEDADLVADLVIVGAGPVGLYAIYYAGFRGLSVVAIDALPEPGGQMTALYPEKPVYDIAGFPQVRAQDLVDNLVRQAEQARPTYLLGHRAVELDQDDDGVTVRTDRGATVRAAGLLITGGMGGFVPRPLPVGNEYVGRGVRHAVPRPVELAGRDVLVVGGGDSAVDWALCLEPLAASVTLVHRRPTFRAHAASVDQLHASSVRVLTPYELTAVHGEDSVSGVDLLGPDGVRTLPVTEIVGAIGFQADLSALADWGLGLARRHIPVDRSMQTCRPRVFAAGDIADHPGKVRLISVGFGEAATAVNHLAPLARPDLSVVPGHSSDLGADGSAAPEPAAAARR